MILKRWFSGRQVVLQWACFLLCLCTVSCQKEELFSDVQQETRITLADSRFQAAEIQLFSDTIYRIGSDLQIRSGQTLRIEPGTLIKVENGYRVVVLPGGKIIAEGSVDAPIIMTSAANPGAQGVFLGNTTTAWGGVEVRGGVGLNSGSLKYLRIEFPGFPGSVGGLVLQGVDSSMILDHVQVSYSYAAPSFVFNGGVCSAEFLVSLASSYSDFVFQGRYAGKLQHLLAYRLPGFPFQFVGNTIAGILVTQPGTKPLISQATVIGPDNQPGTSRQYVIDPQTAPNAQKAAMVISNDALFRVRNSVIIGFPSSGIFLDGRASALSLPGGASELAYSYIHSNDTSRVFYLNPSLFPGVGSADLRSFLMQPQFANTIVPDTRILGLAAPYQYEHPDLLPVAGSSLLSGANYAGSEFNHPFFRKVNYVGAFGETDWMSGWTNFIPLQTRYNN